MARHSPKCDAGASDEESNDATRKKNPAEGGAYRPLGGVAPLTRWPRIALRDAPARMNRFAPIKLFPISPEPLLVVTGGRLGAMLAGCTGNTLMRNALTLSTLILLLSLPALAAGEKPAGTSPEQAAIESLKDVDFRNLFDACYGDRYETDADLNDGNRVTDEEIHQLLNPPRS